jgi:hypothetical protein
MNNLNIAEFKSLTNNEMLEINGGGLFHDLGHFFGSLIHHYENENHAGFLRNMGVGVGLK